MPTLIQDDRLIQIDTPLGANELLVAGFSGTESLSELFEFRLELISENPAIDVAQILGKNVTVRIRHKDGQAERYFNGYINRFLKRSDFLEGYPVYEATMVPWLWFLTLTSDCLIFQEKSVSDILQKLFRQFNTMLPVVYSLTATYNPLEYCVQYRETTFAFTSRLMEEYGIWYAFDHASAKHEMLLGDAPTAHKVCPVQDTVRWEPNSGQGWLRDEDTVMNWVRQTMIHPGQWSQADFNFKTPRNYLVSVSPSVTPSMKQYELFDYPGRFPDRGLGDSLTRTRMEESETGYEIITGNSDVRAFQAGFKFTLSEHPVQAQNAAYVLVSVTHEAQQRGFRSNEEKAESYENRFQCMPASRKFRPARMTPRPAVKGPQTAIVVGPSGEEIYTDEYGRVKVQFHWDRAGLFDAHSSCWVRVSQAMAGAKWGFLSLPRIGQEVIVSFLEGDPDRPLITGRVYNADNMPPYTLPGEMTKSTLKTNSSKGGQGFNEMRFEDKKGSEQLFFHAEKDMDIRVKNDRKEWIGQDRHLVVTRDRFQKVGRDEHTDTVRDRVEKIGRDLHTKVEGKRSTQVTGSNTLKVQGDMIEVFQANHSEQTTGNIYLKGANVVVEAMTGLTIKVGGNFVTINAAGVQIKGTMVMINSAGAALSGSPGSPVTPLSPTAAQDAALADPGIAVQAYQAQPPVKPVPVLEGLVGASDTAPVVMAVVPASETGAMVPVDAVTHQPNAAENKKKTAWIEIELVDEQMKPVAGEVYLVTLPDGATVDQGTTNEQGRARIENFDPGTCQVSFPNLDKDAYKPL